MLSLLVVGLGARGARAYPWMIRHGFAECGSCHVDPMGGETLTEMGRVVGEGLLRMPWGAAPSAPSRFLFAVDPVPNLYLGGSLRALALKNLDTGRASAFPMQADLTSAGVIGRFTLAAGLGVSRASRRYEHSSKARLLGNVEAEDLLLVSRNHWLGYRPSDTWLLRLGRINLPFGIRTPEHTLWVRSETSTDRESDQQHGISPAKPAVILAEADVLAKSGARPGYAGIATLDVEPVQGLHLAGTGEVIDRGEPPSGPALGRGQTHIGGWLTLDWFFAPQLELRVDLVLRQNRGTMLQTQLHLSL